MITVVPSNINANASNHLTTEDQMSTSDPSRPRDTRADEAVMQSEPQTLAIRSGEAKSHYNNKFDRVPGTGQATSSEVCLEERQENPVIPVQSGQSLGYKRQFVARITDSGRDGHTNGVDVTSRNGPTTSYSSLLPPKLSRKRKHCDTEKSSSSRWKHEERLNSTSDVHSDWELPVKRARMDFNRSGCAICRAPEYDVTDMLQCWCTFFVGDGEIEEMH
ncbi:hypothetical protein CPB84DRAFT_1795327 [Gymnopilus junonius]|uniref:Uncharacterized protein n=1 Tax=Gymnopilus junonius TaxID=109634 RepID=A0A9P5THK3_GYMJU|nr:hypothetical protein CPB84DRAFT_1795327 [Gymnopilus junonius]